MITKKILVGIVIWVLAASGCTSIVTPVLVVEPSAVSRPTLTTAPTLASSATLPPLATTSTPTLTPVPTVTFTSTTTLTPTITATASRTPSKTPAFNRPGLHQINLCGHTTYHYSDSRVIDFNGPFTLTMDLCVTTVLVNNDLTMRFNLEWRLVTWDGPLPSRYMYASNDYMSLGDNLSNGYGRIGDSGIVVDNDVVGGKPDTYMGWYLFPAPKEGATTFTLFDTKKKVTVPGIMLWPGK